MYEPLHVHPLLDGYPSLIVIVWSSYYHSEAEIKKESELKNDAFSAFLSRNRNPSALRGEKVSLGGKLSFPYPPTSACTISADEITTWLKKENNVL
jgi:hypothetical protein